MNRLRFMLEGPWPCSLCMNYIIAMLLLDRAHVTTFCILPGVTQGQPHDSKQKHTTRNFAKFPNHFPHLAMPAGLKPWYDAYYFLQKCY